MERLGGHVPEHIRTITQHGTQVQVDWRPVIFREGNEVAEHEKDHILAGPIVSATIFRQGDALGSTKPVRLTAAAAGAPGGNGKRGWGHDRFLSEFVLGVPWESAMAQGRAATAGMYWEGKAVVSALMEHGTIYQFHVDEAYKRAEEAKKGIATVDVFIIERDGRKTRFTEKTAKSGKEIASELEEKDRIRNEQDVFKWTDQDQALFEAEADRQKVPV